MKVAARRSCGTSSWLWGTTAASTLCGGASRSLLLPRPTTSFAASGSPTSRRQWYAAKASGGASAGGGKRQQQQQADAGGGQASALSYFVARTSSNGCGIVGMPNVGKSTLFNALTSSQRARAENFPFCTIDPNVGKVWVPDPRLDTLAALANSKRTLPCQMEFVDIAGFFSFPP